MTSQSLAIDKSKETTIVLADDHKVVRQGLRAVLEFEPGFRVIGEAGNGLDATRLVERLRPNVLVLDLMIPGLSGLEVTRQLRKRSPKTRVVILSMHSDKSYVPGGIEERCGGLRAKGLQRRGLNQGRTGSRG